MKSVLLALPLLAAPSAAVAADNHSAAHATAPVSAEAPAKLTINAPIEALVANEQAKAVLNAYLPGMTEHPSYPMFKAMSLRDVQPFSQGMITDDTLSKIAVALAEIK